MLQTVISYPLIHRHIIIIIFFFHLKIKDYDNKKEGFGTDTGFFSIEVMYRYNYFSL